MARCEIKIPRPKPNPSEETPTVAMLAGVNIRSRSSNPLDAFCVITRLSSYALFEEAHCKYHITGK
jgi:hypothetical protein